MGVEVLKKAAAVPSETRDETLRGRVREILERVDEGGEQAVRELALRFDDWQGEFVLSDDKRAALIAAVPQGLRDDLVFAHAQIRTFAEAQRESLRGFEIETEPGVVLGQRIVPVGCAGCYVPGGRYAHAASALMSITTAKAAGVPTVVACSPPRGASIDPAIAFAMDLAGADIILEIGGVHAIATLARGLFTGCPADIVVGPGNAYVAEAKRQLFGTIGIDVIAGPTESAIVAEEGADPMTIAVDLVSQAEHGIDSPVWFVTTSRQLGEQVAATVERVAAEMPNAAVVTSAWRDHGEIVFCHSREEAASVCDDYAPEHLQVLADDLEWWKGRLRNYGSLFLGEGSTVTHGDKCAGTNHILPTRGAARYSGGLNVQKFLKILTTQQIAPEANRRFSAVGSRISRAEGMEGHARACDWRLRKYFPDEEWDFPVYDQPRHD